MHRSCPAAEKRQSSTGRARHERGNAPGGRKVCRSHVAVAGCEKN
jgi:hypothetical protein